jgi:hypothetical protein
MTGTAEHGGIQIVAYPLKAEFYRPVRHSAEEFCWGPESLASPRMTYTMGLAPGGKMRQHIYKDGRKLSHWATDNGSRCFVHIANSLAWRTITDEHPPTVPFTSKEYQRWGMPWFDYYGGDKKALGGGSAFSGLKSVLQLGKEKGESPLPENESVTPGTTIKLGKKVTPAQVREGTF